MKKVCLTLLCWLSLRFLLLLFFLPILADAVLQDSVLNSSIGLPVRRIWAAILLLPLLMPFFGGGAAETSSSAGTSASSTDLQRAATRQRVREHRASSAVVRPIEQDDELPLRRPASPIPAVQALQSQRARGASQAAQLPQRNSSSSSAAISASSTDVRIDVRRAATSQRVRDHRASSAVAPPIPADQALQSQGARGAAVPNGSIAGISSSSSAAASSGSRIAAERVQIRNASAAAARARDQAIEASIMGSFAFTEAELKFAADNFEDSPIAALAFLAANTGIANSPSDLGPLLDGVPDPAPLIAAFKSRTEAPLHGCACCGMRSVQCRAINMLQQWIKVHKMPDAEQLEFAALPEAVRQVKSTCVIAGSRYLLHPELVHLAPGHMHSRTSLTSSHLSQGSFQMGILSRRICALLAQTQLVPLVEYIRCLFGQAAILATWPESVRHCKG